jgi:CRP-like cAMP-binding protein
VYFIIKGTVIFYLGEEYNYQQIYEVKKNRNFGEIEMCLNEKLSHNIKVKTRQCELFLLKKNDFLKVSVNFPEQIQNFLSISLMKYLRFNDEKKRIMMENQKELELNESILKSNEDLNDLSHISEESNGVTNKTNSSDSKFDSSLSSSSNSIETKSIKSQSDKSKLSKPKKSKSNRSFSEHSKKSPKLKEINIVKPNKSTHSISLKPTNLLFNQNEKNKDIKRNTEILNGSSNLLNQINIPKKKTFSYI